jgi:hypothetical protein
MRASPLGEENAVSTVNPVQTTTYNLSSSNNPITFGTGTDINVSNGNGVYGAFVPGQSWYVTNAGTITGGTGSREAGISVVVIGSTVTNEAGGTISGYLGVYLDIGSTVTNAGTISASRFGVDDRHNNGTIINEQGGSIYGAGLGAYIAGGTLTNDFGGTISSSATGVGVSIYTESGHSSTVTNAGTITGGDDSIYFGGKGVNTLILMTGSTLNGTAQGSTDSGATNALVLEGTGTANNNFEDFNTLTVMSAGNWTLGGSFALGGSSSSFGEATIDAGALLNFDGGTTIAGTVTGAGTLELGGGSTTLDSGAELSVAYWTLGGSGTTVTLDENLT